VRFSAQKTRKLNPQPHLVTRTKGLAGKLENTEEEDLSLNQEENNIQDATVEKNENMKETRSSPPPAIPTKNRFEVLQPQETSLSQRQDHQTINYNKRTKNTKYDRGKHKKKRTKKCETKQASRLRPWWEHIRDKTKDIRINILPVPPRKLTISQIKRPTPIDKVTEGSSTTWTAHQPPYRGTNGRPLTCKR
jgi:hypothetical protein